VFGEQPDHKKKSAELTLSHRREHMMQDSSQSLESSLQSTVRSKYLVGDNKREEVEAVEGQSN
jgi:hypothetical protein